MVRSCLGYLNKSGTGIEQGTEQIDKSWNSTVKY
jgi:hypothetical protein